MAVIVGSYCILLVFVGMLPFVIFESEFVQSLARFVEEQGLEQLLWAFECLDLLEDLGGYGLYLFQD